MPWRSYRWPSACSPSRHNSVGAGRAHFTAEWEDESSVVFINQGPGSARDVQVSFSPSPDEGDKPAAGAQPKIPTWGPIRLSGCP